MNQFIVAHVKFDYGFDIHALKMVKAVMKDFTITQKIYNCTDFRLKCIAGYSQSFYLHVMIKKQKFVVINFFLQNTCLVEASSKHKNKN